MAGFRELITTAKLRIHERFEVDALCYLGGSTSNGTPVTCRVHTAFTTGGDLPETGFSFSERIDITPRLVFLKADHTPARGNVYAIDDGEAYVVTRLEDPEAVTITAVADRISASEAERWPGP